MSTSMEQSFSDPGEYKLLNAADVEAALQACMGIGTNIAERVSFLMKEQAHRPERITLGLAHAEWAKLRGVCTILHNMGFTVSMEKLNACYPSSVEPRTGDTLSSCTAPVANLKIPMS